MPELRKNHENRKVYCPDCGKYLVTCKETKSLEIVCTRCRMALIVRVQGLELTIFHERRKKK